MFLRYRGRREVAHEEQKGSSNSLSNHVLIATYSGAMTDSRLIMKRDWGYWTLLRITGSELRTLPVSDVIRSGLEMRSVNNIRVYLRR